MTGILVLYDHSASICSQMARLALVEKELSFQRHAIDIIDGQARIRDGILNGPNGQGVFGGIGDLAPTGILRFSDPDDVRSATHGTRSPFNLLCCGN